jgi:hypothetical protein
MARFLYDPVDPAELDAVHALQRQLTVRTLKGYLDGSENFPPVPDLGPSPHPSSGSEPAATCAFQRDRAATRGPQRGGQPGRPRAEDDDVVLLDGGHRAR